MVFHWQSNVNVQQAGVEDMVLLRQLNDDSIVDNLKKRLAAKAIYTYIGPVLISVNPFKELPYFTDKEMDQYRGAAQYENPPHIYALADSMHKNMLIDAEKQCVIISGESGAGKTVSAKHIMNYIAAVSGGGERVKAVKDVIINSNPLLEAFGNASTLRNWNSSRFGKYVQIDFGAGGEPMGGKISTFLLEKSRVCSLGKGERSFHFFYQLLEGTDPNTREHLGISNPTYYNYLRQSGCYKAEGTDDRQELAETLKAMQVVGIREEAQLHILQLVAGILHIGNITFAERNNYACVANDDYLQFPSYLLGLNENAIKEKLTTRRLESKWGKEKEEIDIQLNEEQAAYTRDALTKSLYARLFDYLVTAVNKALSAARTGASTSATKDLSVGILDIYGFEIFDNNSFEQFCINYVNERLQQIFIELTLKSEQEEYLSEGIKWTPIDYFNNLVVCELIEGRKPPGLMCILDDVCSQLHGQSEGADAKLLVKLNQQMGATNEHYRGGSGCFVVTHYAGDVNYQVEGFCDKNRDVLYDDLIQLMQGSTIPFMRNLFPESTASGGAKAKPTSASTKIRTQANQLVESLMQCTPHYVRCIKPNENKRALEFDSARCLHQVQYLGLKENIRVRRAGYAFRRPFAKFLWRYAILTTEKWPNEKRGCEIICAAAGIAPEQYQLGTTKLFIKNPESLFLLEEARQRKYDGFARLIQKAFRRFTANKHFARQKEEASDLLFNKKERRRFSINRNFVGDYIGLEHHPGLQAICGRRERIDFAHTVTKYDRRFKSSKVDLLVTAKHLTLVGRELIKKGVNKGKLVEVVKRQIPLEKIEAVGLSPLQDDFCVVQVVGEHATLLETPLKTEMLTALSKRYKDKSGGRQLALHFTNCHSIPLKKTKIDLMGTPAPREIRFELETGAGTGAVTLKPVGKVLIVSVPPGLPANTKPSAHRPQQQQQKKWNGRQQGHQEPRTVPTHRAPAPSANGIHLPSAGRINGRQNAVYPVVGSGGASAPAMSRPMPAPKPKPAVKPKGPVVKALYPYEAQDTDELSFKEGQVIDLLQKDESGWWQGSVGSKTGLFPANYVVEQ